MEHVSIDGRRRNKSSAPAVKPSRKPETEPPPNLRPASPPKSNPWASTKKRTPNPLADTFPPLPKPQAPLSPVKTPAAEMSRASSLSPSKPPFREDIGPVTLVARSASPSSNTSSTSRHIFEAAAPRATEYLWRSPFGADVVVHAGDRSFRVHRNIVVPESGWFRDNLPPPNLDGSPVVVQVAFAAEAIAHCLRFIYTGRIEICDFDPKNPWKAIHLPRCILGYCAAVRLRMAKMTSHLLRVVENTSVELGALIQTEYLHRTLSCPEWTQFSWHYQGASEILYSEPFQKLMMPMRLAMASILDAVLFWFMQQPLFFSELKSAWYKIVQANVPDIAEYRRLHRQANLYYNSPLPNEATLKQLFEQMGPKEEAKKSVGTQTEDIPGGRGWMNDQQHNLLTVRRERRGSL